MSWIFGYGKKQPDNTAMPTGLEGLSAPPAGGAGSPDVPNLSRAEKKAMEAYRFDSSALERAAQAARELERSSK